MENKSHVEARNPDTGHRKLIVKKKKGEIEIGLAWGRLLDLADLLDKGLIPDLGVLILSLLDLLGHLGRENCSPFIFINYKMNALRG